jgi:hypothetical protein
MNADDRRDEEKEGGRNSSISKKVVFRRFLTGWSS